MSTITILIITFCLPIVVKAQSVPSILECECVQKVRNDFLTDSTFGKKKWSGFEKATPLSKKIFSGLSSRTPTIKSITPPYQYFPEGEVNEFAGSLIYRSGSMLIIKWENPAGNKIWIATINLENKKAIVAQSYNGLTSFGINVEILDCK